MVPEQMADQCCEVVVTAADPGWLAAFTRSLVADRVVACGHITEAIRSVYRWQGEIHDEPEAVVRLHTRVSQAPAVVQRCRDQHPYQVPCVITVPILDGNPDYLAWILDCTDPPG